MRLASIVHSLLEARVRLLGTDLGSDLVVQARVLCTGRGTVVGEREILLGGCTAALVALGRQLEHVDGAVEAALASVRECGSRVLKGLEILRAILAVASRVVSPKLGEGILRASWKGLLLPVPVMASLCSL